MKFDFLNALSYLFYHKHRWSKASMIGPLPFDEHVRILGQKNILVSEDPHCKRIQWENVCTLYVFRFSHTGEFQLVEREIWFEYKWPSLSKTVLMEVNRDSNSSVIYNTDKCGRIYLNLN